MIFISAAGQGSRIRPYLQEIGIEDRPKHLLPTGQLTVAGNEETLLSRSVCAAIDSGSAVTVLANQENADAIAKNLSGLEYRLVSDAGSSTLGIFDFIVRGEGETELFSNAGDSFLSPSPWREFMDFHTLGSRPVSLLVQQGLSKELGAAFEVEDSCVTNFYRTDCQGVPVLRNVGLYGVSLTDEVATIVDSFADMPFEGTKHDEICTEFINAGLAQAMMYDGTFFNINSLTDYRELLDHTSSMPVRA